MEVMAFKEWSIVVETLGTGAAHIILRKGGIAEDGGDFSPGHSRFVLYPTRYHQKKELIRPEFNVNDVTFKPGYVVIKYWAEVRKAFFCDRWETIARLAPFHAITESIIKERFDRWNSGVWVLLVRVYKFNTPKEIAVLKEYEGCKSWITVRENFNFSDSTSVISDMNFNEIEKKVTEILESTGAARQ